MPTALEIILKTTDCRSFEIIDFHKCDGIGNYAVIHMPDNTVTPYVAVWNLQDHPTLPGWCWDMGHYCSTRQQAEKKFYELTRVIKG